MTRTRADSLVLVNWKGVFYYRYQLDRHVTALEGSNGAGKTTVMIAAYLVLLPDLSKLRFTNLGETAATGGDRGIWGRLGQEGRPSYAAIDFALADGSRLVAGVHLVRKGEPSVEPTPLLVHGLGNDVRLQDLFLLAQGDQDAVPEIDELRQNAARLGGRLQTCTSAKDYFAALFELGVTPLRLGTEAERTKMNDMLRTSMTGGISRALTTELRGFLLKEESGLADTLQRMKANLDACRRTRSEVAEAKLLQQEIGEVFAAGQTMFTAAFLAGRERAADAERRVQEAEVANRAAAAAAATAGQTLADTEAELQQLELRKGEHEQAVEHSQAWLQRVRGALLAWRELSECEQTSAARHRELDLAAMNKASAEALRDRRREERRRAEGEQHRAAVGIADLQRGIEDLHRRAGAYRQAKRNQHEAQRLLGLEVLEVEHIPGQLAATQQRLAAIDAEKREAAARLGEADAHRRQHGIAMAALAHMVGHEVAAPAAHATATAALQRQRELVALGQRAPDLARLVEEARQLADSQQRTQRAAAALAIPEGDTQARDRIQALLDEHEATHRQHSDQERELKHAISQLERERSDLEQQLAQLRDREPSWRRLHDGATRISQQLATPITSRLELEQARKSLAEQFEAARNTTSQLATEQQRLRTAARELLTVGGPFPPALLRLRDQLGASLVAESFEDVDPEQAGPIEARLGPLARALVVEDPRAAAANSQHRDASLTEVMLVARDANLLLDATTIDKPHGPDLCVPEGEALRVSRIPQHPHLGRKARERRAAELNAMADAMDEALAAARTQQRQLEQRLADGEDLLADLANWLAGDPTIAIAAVQRQLTSSANQIDAKRKQAAAAAETCRGLRPQIDGLRRLLPDSHLLDPPDHNERWTALQAEHRTAVAAAATAQKHAKDASLVEQHLHELRQPPLSDQEIHHLQQRIAALRQQRDELDAARDALEALNANHEALQWHEAPQRLLDHQGLVPALEAQLREALAASERAQQAVDAAEQELATFHAAWQEADGNRRLAEKAQQSAAAAFAKFDLVAPTEAVVAAAEQATRQAKATLDAATQRRETLLGQRGEQRNALAVANTAAVAAANELTARQREAEPQLAAWQQLQQRAVASGLHHGLPAELPTARGQVNLLQEAKTQQTLLLDRLHKARDGKPLVEQFQGLRDTNDAGFAAGVLDLWLLVRDWLRRRLPTQVAEVNDPREALQRLADQLHGLEQRLTTQENDLRGNNEDVARGIDVQVRKARGHVARLNKSLQGVGFGSIAGIRVRLELIEKMDRVLRALREGAAQGLLFQSDMPIEEALDQIFQRYGGGRTGGQRLLDYREYLHLQVEVRRNSGQEWEMANPTRLSTGEAIGVGAALMMVVLTEWERDATLLRGKKSGGSVRFLFLDEANRLSHDNLGVLFELCRTLDLQLLIAAPEVARAEGNTTYHLVRTRGAAGNEEVVVSPRRIRARS